MKSHGSACLSLAVAVVLGAAIAGVIGSDVDEQAVAQGRSLLVLAGRRLETPVVFAVAWAVFGVLSMMPFDRRSRAHAEELREVARTLGLAYEEGVVKESRGLHPGAPLFERWVRCENRLSGTVDGAPAAMFDLMTIEGTGEGETRRSWTVILFAQSRLPFFVCVPRRWTTGAERATLTPINFDPRAEDEWTRQAVAAFERVYVLGLSDVVSASGEDAIRRHFCAPRLEAMAHYPNWHVQSASGFIAFALGWTAPAADRPALWHEAARTSPGDAGAALRRRDPHSRRTGNGRGTPARPPRPGSAPGASPAPCSALSAVSLPSALSWPAGWARPAPAFDRRLQLMPFFYFGSILGGLLIGTLAGRWLGGLVVDLRSTPTPGGAPLPRSTRAG